MALPLINFLCSLKNREGWQIRPVCLGQLFRSLGMAKWIWVGNLTCVDNNFHLNSQSRSIHFCKSWLANFHSFSLLLFVQKICQMCVPAWCSQSGLWEYWISSYFSPCPHHHHHHLSHDLVPLFGISPKIVISNEQILLESTALRHFGFTIFLHKLKSFCLCGLFQFLWY